MVKVITQANFFAEGVLYKRDRRTGTVDVPADVLKRNELPKRAVIVDKNYVAPAKEEAKDDHRSVDQLNAEALAAKEAEAQAVLDARKGEQDDPLMKLLSGSVNDVVSSLADYGVEDLKKLQALEEGGKNRTTLLVQIEAAIEDAESAE